MENVLIDQSSGRFDYFRRSTAGDGGCRRTPAPPPRSIYNSFTNAPPFQYTLPYQLYSSPSLPPLPYSYLPPQAVRLLVSHPPPVGFTRYRTFPYRQSLLPPSVTASKGKATTAAVGVKTTRSGDCNKRKKSRTPRSTDEPPRAPHRRRPLERAAPLPPLPAVTEALDDLEREVTRGFVEDMLQALAPPPSSLPLPTFSLVGATATKAAASCAAV
ncbi:hypothetical protein GUJ93_ZPchr0012g21849 [Zizania palustris]|uniref:Uncharacterized protein n=1 Tax=Zizania palustris TaxID=103762 RepID=A0A8J5WVE6_ZIZPA|nr:hypothetical protein GUJ93_ZPchr0012g21849 [Zizania palustris]